MAVVIERGEPRSPAIFPPQEQEAIDVFGDLTDDQIISKLESIDRPYTSVLRVDGSGVYIVRNEILLTYDSPRKRKEAHIMVTRPKDQAIILQRADEEDYSSKIAMRASRWQPLDDDIATRKLYMSSGRPIAYVGEKYCITYLGMKRNEYGRIANISLQSSEPIGIPQLKIGVIDYNKALRQARESNSQK